MEAILLLRAEPSTAWDSTRLAQRLYLLDKRADQLLRDLAELRIAEQCAPGPSCYRYLPATPELTHLVDALADTYAKHLIDVTHLIHGTPSVVAETFAAAFRFSKDRGL
ncbi:hypothetical protein [Tahibacter amnicola]|uniref:Transcriptional regulator n=1 Tax=Tahibacter amnicola TaxID=2976241 RepID=A0ABY6BC14_9GAMM|nr:hypothetical protein [Tahibacter amnicola]UXI66176.1 hypothetical protein N4264_15615 [Tahibacter amnicola]